MNNYDAHIIERQIWLRNYKNDRANELINYLVKQPQNACKLIHTTANK